MSFIPDIELENLLFIIAKIANENPENIPILIPPIILESISFNGITIEIPIKVIIAVIIFLLSNFSLKNKGYINVVKIGKLEKVRSPRATLDNLIA